MLRVWMNGIYAALIALSWQASTFAADTVLINGHIYTGNKAAPWADALAITGARIEAVGSSTEVAKHGGGHARVIDLKGRTVIPGIVDSHLHLLFGAYALHGLNLSTPESSITPSKPDLLIARLRAYATAHPDDLVLFCACGFQHCAADDTHICAPRSRSPGPSPRDSPYLRARAMAQLQPPLGWPASRVARSSIPTRSAA